MKKVPELRELFDPPEEIIQAGLDGQLVLFIGAGASMLVGMPSWSELANNLLKELRKNGYINYSEMEQFDSLDPKKRISIADLLAKENDYDFKFGDYFSGIKEGNSIYKAINDIGCPCVTTNYDKLIAPRYFETKDGSTIDASVSRISEKQEFFANKLNEPGTVVHLHGVFSNRNSMILTTKEYLEHYEHEKVQFFLDELFKIKTVLFIGYGLEEDEILEHILRKGSARSTDDRKRFALQGFHRREKPLYKNLYQYYKRSFGVHLLGFVRDHEDYHQSEIIIKSWVNKIKVRKPSLAADYDFMVEVLEDE